MQPTSNNEQQPEPRPVPNEGSVMKRVEQPIAQPAQQTPAPVPTPPVKEPAPIKEVAPASAAITPDMEAIAKQSAAPAVPSAPPVTGEQAKPETVAQIPEESEQKAEPVKEEKPKKSFFSFGKKTKEKEVKTPTPKKAKQKSGLSAFFASINNIGMGKQRLIFVQNMAMMLGAGLSLLEALKTLALEAKNRAMKKAIKRISDEVESGTPLWKAMEQQYLFSPYEIALVHIGEDAGHLARNMEYLSIQQEKDNSLRQKVKIAMIYPTIVLVLMFIIVMGLGLFVLPNLITVLISLNAELPLTTRIVINITNVFNDHGGLVVGGSIGSFILIFLLSKYTSFRIVTQWMVFHIPGIGRLASEATIARFGVILGGLLQAGVPLVESLKSLEEVTHTVSHKKLYGKILEHINQGDSFSITFKAIKRSDKLLPVSVQQLIITGEQSGSLAETLLKISDIYDKKAAQTAEKLPVVLEPMLLLFVGALVGTIAFAIITPIYGVVGSVGR